MAEFEKHDFIQMVFPHEKTDWHEYLEEARQNFVAIVEAIRKYEKVLLVCADVEEAKRYFLDRSGIVFVKYESDDTWARDSSAVSVEENGKTVLYDFVFNAWGGKFDAEKDNAMTQALKKYYTCDVKKEDFILEGGGIETNGRGILLTTSACMLNQNRNKMEAKEVTERLRRYFGVKDIVYLQNGYLLGDDTDSHIDTLARFVDEKTIMYVRCEEKSDEHYEALYAMEQELKELTKVYDFQLIPLPFCDPLFYKGERLPATYANFLMINGAVVVPIYGVKQDQKAFAVFRSFFQDRDVVGVDCSVLVRQHGSLHCVTMQMHCENQVKEQK